VTSWLWIGVAGIPDHTVNSVEVHLLQLIHRRLRNLVRSAHCASCRWWSSRPPGFSARGAPRGRRGGQKRPPSPSSRPQIIKTAAANAFFHGAVWNQSRLTLAAVGASPDPELVGRKARQVPKNGGVGFERPAEGSRFLRRFQDRSHSPTSNHPSKGPCQFPCNPRLGAGLRMNRANGSTTMASTSAARLQRAALPGVRAPT